MLTARLRARVVRLAGGTLHVGLGDRPTSSESRAVLGQIRLHRCRPCRPAGLLGAPHRCSRSSALPADLWAESQHCGHHHLEMALHIITVTHIPTLSQHRKGPQISAVLGHYLGPRMPKTAIDSILPGHGSCPGHGQIQRQQGGCKEPGSDVTEDSTCSSLLPYRL